MNVLEQFRELIAVSPQQKEYERLERLWKKAIRNPDLAVLVEHMQSEINRLHQVLEQGDNESARAEIRVYRNILQIYDNHVKITNEENK